MREAWRTALPTVVAAQILLAGCQVERTAAPIDEIGEQEIFLFVNQKRIELGITPLAWDERLAEISRDHAIDMLRRDYADHISPDGQSPADRLKAREIDFITAGENLARVESIDRANKGFMESPGHAENITNPSFTRIGVGVIKGPTMFEVVFFRKLEAFPTRIVVQMFTGTP